MIKIKTAQEIEEMKPANQLVARVLDAMYDFVQPGRTTLELNNEVERIIRAGGGIPSFLGYGEPPFPGSACVSVDDEVVHGIPQAGQILEAGSIVTIDVGAIVDGWHGDAARTYAVGNITDELEALLRYTEESFWAGFAQARPGQRLGDIQHAIEKVALAHHYGIVRELTGHGIGREMHEDPEIPNYGRAGHGPRLEAGMVLAVEPMFNLGHEAVTILDDQWTIVTQDGRPSCHYENTFAITANGAEILTRTRHQGYRPAAWYDEF